MKTRTEFDLTAVVEAARADGESVGAMEEMHCAMLSWHAAGVYPARLAIEKALREGYARTRAYINDGTLTQYASGILKWAKAGRVPTRLTMTAFQGKVPGSESPAGRKPGRKPAPKPAPEMTIPAGAPEFLKMLRMVGPKIPAWGLQAADTEKVREAHLALIAVLDAIVRAAK